MRPWFTCTQMSCLPMALMSSAATTELSTPPERASRTFLSPICSRTAATCSSMKAWASSGVVMRTMSSGRLFGSMQSSFWFAGMRCRAQHMSHSPHIICGRVQVFFCRDGLFCGRAADSCARRQAGRARMPSGGDIRFPLDGTRPRVLRGYGNRPCSAGAGAAALPMHPGRVFSW